MVKDSEQVALAARSTSRGAKAEAKTGEAPDSRLNALATERLAIEGVSIEIDGGRFPAKVVAGSPSQIEADIFSDGHDLIDAAFIYRETGTERFHEVPMALVENDRWGVIVTLPHNAAYECSFLAWRDLYATWRMDTAKKHAAGVEIALELGEGRRLIEAALAPGGNASREDKAALRDVLKRDKALEDDGERFALLGNSTVVATMKRAGPRTHLTRYKRLQVFADREAAAFSAWYEMMPRSQSGDPHRHGTFDDVIARLPYVRDLGFDVLYFHADPPDRQDQPQGPQQQPDGGAGRPGQPLCDRRGGGRARCAASRARHASRTSSGWSRRRASTGSRSRSTSPSSARPTIPGSRSIRSGSTGGPTAPSSSPRTRRRSTRTSSMSTSTATPSPASGTSCATWCCSGSATG